jgi:DNA-binding NarL/FixJ family response regulator
MNTDLLVGIVDDHALFRKGLAALINLFPGHQVILQAENGKDMIEKLKTGAEPTILLLDIDMREMNGYETAEWLRNNHPDIRVLALSTMDADTSIIKMIRHGAKGYVLKDSEPEELKLAMSEVVKAGYYYNDLVSRKVMRSINQIVDDTSKNQGVNSISTREMEFLRLACSEKSYKEIAGEMFLSERTIDGYRESLFEKLKVNTRVGLVIYAIKNKLVMI